MIENLFHEGHEQKTFFAWKSLYKPLSGPELRSWIRFLMIEKKAKFTFCLWEKGKNSPPSLLTAMLDILQREERFVSDLHLWKLENSSQMIAKLCKFRKIWTFQKSSCGPEINRNQLGNPRWAKSHQVISKKSPSIEGDFYY